jgi:sporulation inhibitor KapD
MKKIIYEINSNQKTFYVIHEGKKIGFYLTVRLYKTFFDYLDQGVLVDFEIASRRKKIDRVFFYQVSHFNKIIALNPYKVYYDIAALRKEVKEVISKNKYFLFIDFEMTMPGYREQKFCPQIIQVGYVLAESNLEPILSDSYYVVPKEQDFLSRRTKKFLKLDEDVFFAQAVHFMSFYDKLKEIIKTYHPKLVVWGKNDMTALHESYKIHEQKPLTKETDFIDLLKLHKDYFNLKDDLGLFKAYKAYYHMEYEQHHDAKDDAMITKYVFDAFIEYI